MEPAWPNVEPEEAEANPEGPAAEPSGAELN